LLKTGKPFVIENIPRAPIRQDLILTGMMFNLPIIRKRAFEIHGFWCLAPNYPKKKGSVKT
jgi:DNA (cytosine-5)-methyltransferase 1